MSDPSLSCPFCHPDGAVLSNDLAHARYDRHPVTPGHLLIIPNRHVASYFETSDAEKLALLSLLDEAYALLEREYRPDGYNVGINIGAAAGQSIPHVHLHLIPRYTGDVAAPRGGVRGVIPTRQSY
ncbi:HIT family protein [Crenobacter sp. SG2303]|uniref:HIT family protein n=1 Tax=Crenobacter oryzisoli TaxID=3056844 RepID=A0ABT7XLN2_9NEIS|nr:HIT family protein [Crenobacter sp. SG2303]MDN0074703.1 HIT family protein [Crenobacter sp. SG2303]